MQELKWWEKTVEYQFVFLLLRHKRLFLAPLDGKEESAGDLAIGIATKWVLIEFKKDSEAIKSEEDKYTNFAAVQKKFVDRDAHHHIIFGFSNTSKEEGVVPKLALAGLTYFSRASRGINVILNSGVDLETFKQYIVDLTKEKKTTASAGGLSPETFGMVAGVTSSGGIVECKSMREFCLEHGLEHVLELTKKKERSMDGPSR